MIMKKRGDKGQVTICIIIAVLVVVAAILLFIFRPSGINIIPSKPGTPEGFIKDCLQDTIDENINFISLHGGSLTPKHYFEYQGNKLEYLCYTNEFNKMCVVQQPILYGHVSTEIEKSISSKERECFDSLKAEYEDKGYTVDLKRGETIVDLLPGKVLITFKHSLNLRKGDSTSNIEEFRISLNNNLYELLGIATSIIAYETRFGDSETTQYMNVYPDLKVEKYKQTDGTTVYILTNRDNENVPGSKFQFASRSNAWPPGYGIGS